VSGRSQVGSLIDADWRHASRRTVDQARNSALGFCKADVPAQCAIVNVNNKPAE
jgi:hypothetical protein